MSTMIVVAPLTASPIVPFATLYMLMPRVASKRLGSSHGLYQDVEVDL
jgi:hypothetical protein